MSKRAKDHGAAVHSSAHGSNSARISVLEQKLFELQAYAEDALSRKEGTQRSTRAFNDALLNVEFKLMRQRDMEQQQKIANYEKSQKPHLLTEEINRLNSDLEELRSQCGDKVNQMRILQLEAKDRIIANLTRALAESKKETQAAAAANEALTAEVFILNKQIQKLGAGAAVVDNSAMQAATAPAPAAVADEFDSFFNEVAKRN